MMGIEPRKPRFGGVEYRAWAVALVVAEEERKLLGGNLDVMQGSKETKMPEKLKVLKTPWLLANGEVLDDDGYGVPGLCHAPRDRPRIAEIVCRVNAHDALVEACREAKEQRWCICYVPHEERCLFCMCKRALAKPKETPDD